MPPSATASASASTPALPAAAGATTARVGARRIRDRLRTRFTNQRRTLAIPREGKFLLGITLMVGFAAINTGNNLLFFGWGLLLSSILISGILSESTLRVVQLELQEVGECRAHARSPLGLVVNNSAKHLPAFGIACGVVFDDPRSTADKTNPKRSRKEKKAARRLAHARYLLRLAPKSNEEIAALYVPRTRGVHVVTELFAKTAYPFGFFEKTRHYVLGHARSVVVYPARIDLGSLPKTLLSRLGQTPTRSAGPGDEFFSLRSWREGDDPRQVAWRVSARTGRMVVKETEVWATREVLLVITPPTETSPLARKRAEAIIAACGSIAEDLLGAQHAVGVVGPGIFVPPARAGRQRASILSALARLDVTAPLANSNAARRAIRVGVTVVGANAPSGSEHVITAPASSIVDVSFDPQAEKPKKKNRGTT